MSPRPSTWDLPASLVRLAEARRSASPGLKNAGRTAARIFGRSTSPGRMLPTFLMVGAQRAGTTSMFRALAAHPAVTPPLFHKGIHYFDTTYQHSPSWYRSHFPVHAVATIRAVRTGSAPQTFESAGYYMHHPLAPGRIHDLLPDVKILVLVRDPVERAYSAHRHEFARGFETEDFETALDLEAERLDGEEERIQNVPGYYSFAHHHHSYVHRGQYAEQIVRLHEVFGPDRVLVVDCDDFFATPEVVYDRTLAFLGLPDWHPASFERHNAQARAPMSASVRHRLEEHFLPHDEALAALLGHTLGWRDASVTADRSTGGPTP